MMKEEREKAVRSKMMCMLKFYQNYQTKRPCGFRAIKTSEKFQNFIITLNILSAAATLMMSGSAERSVRYGL